MAEILWIFILLCVCCVSVDAGTHVACLLAVAPTGLCSRGYAALHRLLSILSPLRGWACQSLPDAALRLHRCPETASRVEVGSSLRDFEATNVGKNWIYGRKNKNFVKNWLRDGEIVVFLQPETSRVWSMYMGSAKSPPA